VNRTGIEYLDFTANPVVGCDMSLPCAEHCWARRMARRLRAAGLPQYQNVVDAQGNWTGKTAFCEEALRELLRRRKPATVGIGFMGDLFHESVPDIWIDRVFHTCAASPQHRFLILTKRSKRLAAYRQKFGMKGFLPNVGLGISASNQAEWEARAVDLLEKLAAMRFLSLEPLLGAVDISPWLRRWSGRGSGLPAPLAAALERLPDLNALDWVIVGGESGPGARPCHPDWVRSVRDQCQAAGVPFYFKQHGEFRPVAKHERLDLNVLLDRGRYVWRDGFSAGFLGPFNGRRLDDGDATLMLRVGKSSAGRLFDGREWLELPEMLK
jgi:protein gp37